MAAIYHFSVFLYFCISAIECKVIHIVCVCVPSDVRIASYARMYVPRQRRCTFRRARRMWFLVNSYLVAATSVRPSPADFNMSKCGPTSHSTYAFFQLLFFLCLLGSTWNAQPRRGTQRTEAKKNKTEMNKNETKRMKAKEHTQAYPQSVRAAAAISIVFMN